jgi:hypothetical protein
VLLALLLTVAGAGPYHFVAEDGRPFALRPPDLAAVLGDAAPEVDPFFAATPRPQRTSAPSTSLWATPIYVSPLQPLARPSLGGESFVYSGVTLNDTVTNTLLFTGGAALLTDIVLHMVHGGK